MLSLLCLQPSARINQLPLPSYNLMYVPDLMEDFSTKFTCACQNRSFCPQKGHYRPSIGPHSWIIDRHIRNIAWPDPNHQVLSHHGLLRNPIQVTPRIVEKKPSLLYITIKMFGETVLPEDIDTHELPFLEVSDCILHNPE